MSLPEYEGVRFACYATNYEQLAIWRETPYEQGRVGHGYTIGEIAGRPVVVCVFVNELNGVKFAFVDATSQLVDWKMVEEWVKQNVCSHVVDAMNFHNGVR